MIGETIGGKYDIQRLIGKGGMGAVYEARHTGTARRVALKVITKVSNDSDELLERFSVEAKAAGIVESDHIAQVFDFGMDEEREIPFLALELLEGETLSELVTRVGALREDAAVRLIAQAARGLATAHAAGVLHRDIKPANIFVAKRDRGRRLVKLLDFGIARLRSDLAEGSKITTTGTLMGSPLYMSPEQTNGLKNVDERSDVFSLGAVMFETLAGRAPHSDTDGIGNLIIQLCTEHVPLREHVPDVSDEVAAIVDRALRIKSEERFQTMAEMLEALEAVQEDDLVTEAMLVPRPSAELDPLDAASPDEASSDEGAAPSAGEPPEAETTRGVTTTAVDLPKHNLKPVWIGLGVAAAAALLLVLRPGGDPEPAEPPPTTTATSGGEPVTTASTSAGDAPTAEASATATTSASPTASATATTTATAKASARPAAPVVPRPFPKAQPKASPPPPPPPPPPSNGFETEM